MGADHFAAAAYALGLTGFLALSAQLLARARRSGRARLLLRGGRKCRLS
jgi:hypothetical protein